MRAFGQYHLPATVDEALELLARYAGRARVVAGGTDLLIDLLSAHHSGERPIYDALVDVTRIAGASDIRLEGDWIIVGCGVTHTQLLESPLIQARATALAEACSVIGGPQVRNVATLIGNVAHGLPAADGTIALVALGAEAQIVRRGQATEWCPLDSLFVGPGQTSLNTAREIIAALRFPPTGEGEGSAFDRIMRPQGVALPILALAARIKLDGRLVASAAIAAGPVAPVPFRAHRTEAALVGREPTAETLTVAGETLLAETSLRSSPHRATREYRLALLPGLLSEVVRRAAERAAVVPAGARNG